MPGLAPAPRWRRVLDRAPALMASVLLAACASTAPRPADEAPALEGRLALRVDGHPERDLNASFELSGNATRGQLQLSGPLGATAARASWSAAGATLRSGDGEQSYASLDELSVQTLGEAFPIAALFDWLRGQPWPGAAHQARDDGIAGFVQLGWRVDLARLSDGWVEARRAGPPAVSVRVRLTPSS